MTSNTCHHMAPYVVNSHYTDLLGEFRCYLDQAGFSPRSLAPKFVSTARHFLLWGRHEGLDLGVIDDSALLGFRDHNCRCFAWKTGGTPREDKRSLGRITVSGAIRFVQFLEDSGRATHLNELPAGNSLLEEFLGEMKASGYKFRAIHHYRNAAQHFLTWLHRWRIAIRSVNSDTVDRFLDHDCLCPTYVRTPSTHCRANKYLITTQAKRNLSSRSGIGGVRSAT